MKVRCRLFASVDLSSMFLACRLLALKLTPTQADSMRIAAAIAYFAALVASSNASGQVGKDTDFWKWTEDAPHHESVVKVVVDDSDGPGKATGTGVLIFINEEKPAGSGFEGYCLTAHHVIETDKGQRGIHIEYPGGRKAKRCKVVAKNRERDVAILWVWVPTGAVAASVAPREAQPGDRLEFAGLGGNSKLACCLRHFSETASVATTSDQIYANSPLLPGDSGGPVFNGNGEVVGIISGGWVWWDGKIRSESGSQIMATWPSRACNLEAIRKLMDGIDAMRSDQRVSSAGGVRLRDNGGHGPGDRADSEVSPTRQERNDSRLGGR